MVWVLLLIPIVVGLFLEYTISSSTIAQKATWRNLLTFTAFLLIACPLIVALLFLPQPWQDYTLLGLFTVFSLIVWLAILSWPRRKRKAGSLLWNLGRTSTQKVMSIAGILFFFSAILQTISLIDLVIRGFSGSHSSPEYYLSQIIFYWSISIYFLWAGLSRLEIRENGIYFKFGLVKWEQIASYKWEGPKANTLTVWLKQRFPFFPTRSWPIPLVHKPTMERILDQHLSGRKKGKRIFS